MGALVGRITSWGLPGGGPADEPGRTRFLSPATLGKRTASGARGWEAAMPSTTCCALCLCSRCRVADVGLSKSCWRPGASSSVRQGGGGGVSIL